MPAKKQIQRLAFYSIFVALGVMGLKFVAWWVTGSVALYSDALESIVNVIAASAAYWAIRISHKPADADHPHGHHKAEYFSAVLEGVLEPIAIEATKTVSCPTIGIGASAQCDGQVLVTEDMLGMFDRVPRFVKKYEDIAGVIERTVVKYAEEVRARSFPTSDQTYQPKG